jgi:sterol desaturase/sphingolipid hydroxylase (fatty acid hydroxylase superfamily)
MGGGLCQGKRRPAVRGMTVIEIAPHLIEPMFDLALPTLAMMFVAAAFLALERIAPGRELPHAPGWYGRAILINIVQVAITFATNHLWLDPLSGVSLFHLARLESAVLQGFIGWFVGTFVFYWWHRIRHLPGFWVVFHQVHHSPARIEAMTAFYKHPVEILTDSALAAVITTARKLA